MERFRLKNDEVLKSQLQTAESSFGDRITPKDWPELCLDDMKTNHKVRYEKYLEIIRESRKPEQADTVPEEARNLVNALNSLENFLTAHENKELSELRNERQVSVFKDLLEFLEKGETSGYVKLPTGVGKTVIFLKLVEALGLKSLIVVPSKILITQTGERLEEFTELEFGAVYSEEKDYDKPVTITTYSSLVSNINSGLINPDNYQVLILDEAHRSLSEDRVAAIEKFHGIKVGFTATPSYSERKSLSNVLENEIHFMNLSEAIEEGLLCETHTIHAYTETDLSAVTVRSSGNYDPEQLEKIINNQARNLAAVQLFVKGFTKDKAVCYCSGVEHAESLQSEFEKAGVSSMVITGDTSSIERDLAFQRFSDGDISVLINAKVLIEGFDEPSCNVVFNLHPTLSVVDAEQRGGRALRLQKGNDKKVGYVVDFIDKSKAEENLPVLFSQILGGASILPRTSNSSKKLAVLLNEDESKDKLETREKEVELASLVIEGLKIDVDAESILQVTNKHSGSKQLQEFPAQKEGWSSIKHLQKIYPGSVSSLRNFITSTYSSNEFSKPEVLIDTDENVPRLFYPPEFIEFLKKKAEQITGNKVKEGWKSLSAVAKEFHTTPARIRELIKQLDITEGIDSRQLFITPNQSHQYYSPKALMLMSEELQRQEQLLKTKAREKAEAVELQRQREQLGRELMDKLVNAYASKVLFEIIDDEQMDQVRALIKKERRENASTFTVIEEKLIVSPEFESSLTALIESFKKPAPPRSPSGWGTYTPATPKNKPKRY